MTPTRRQLLKTVGVAAGATVVPATVSDAARAQTSGDWRMFGHDAANTGHSPAVSGPTENVGATWRFETGNDVRSSAAVADGTVYVGSEDNTLYALDAATGSEQWQYTTGGSVDSSPAVVDGTVYVGSLDGTVYALDAASGAEQWTFETDGAVTSSPTVADGAVYVGSRDAFVYALDAAEGGQLWRFETGFWVETAPAVADGTVYVGSEDNFVYALDAAEGDQVWSFETGDTVGSSPTVVDGLVYAGSLDGNLYALDAATGDRQWSFDTGGAVTASPAVVPAAEAPDVATGGVAYIGSRSHQVHAVDTSSGEQLWSFDTGRPVIGSAAVADGVVYVGSESASLYALDGADGSVRWEFTAGSSIWVSPAVVADTVYVGSRDSNVYALTSGAVETTVQTPSDTAAGGTSTDGTADGSETGDTSGGIANTLFDYRFLLWPVLIASGVGAIAAAFYGAARAGLFDAFGDIGAQPSEYDREPAEDGDDGEESPLWEVVRDDVIARAEETDSTATQDVLVTKYVDSETLSAPMVAYEIESFRDDPTTIRLVEVPESSLSPEDVGSLPGSGDEWALTDEGLVFEATLSPGETRKTLVARRDVDPGDDERLLDRPDITVDE